MIKIYVWASTIFFGLFGLTWNKNDFLNLFVKTFLVTMAIMGTVVLCKLSV